MELPAIHALRASNPDAHITAAGAFPALQILDADPALDELFSLQDWGLHHWGDYGAPGIHPRIQEWLQQQSFDLILDASHTVIALKDAANDSGIPQLNVDPDEQDSLLREGFNGLSAIREGVRRNWGIEVPESLLPRLYLREEDYRFAREFLQGQNGGNNPLIGISPVASSHLKRWPVERLAAVADWLVEARDAHLLLFHGPQREAAEQTVSAMQHRNSVTMAGELHLRKVAALLSRCRLLICNDTGLMHMAAAVGIPAFAVFGPTAPNIYLPQQNNSRAAGWNVQCPFRNTQKFGPSFCLIENHCEAGQYCMNQISTEEVLIELNSFVEDLKQEEIYH
ncbi:MAG: glycosyltransferase family 9 protein [Calditrichia bacterium]